MQNSNTFKLAASLITAGLIYSANSYAKDVDTAGHAMALCTAQAEKTHPGYQRSKSTRIKRRQGVFKIKMKVVTEDDSLTTFCEVTKDGKVSYPKT